jgi:hypothetical protein
MTSCYHSPQSTRNPSRDQVLLATTMFFQMILKGIPGDNDAKAQQCLQRTGLRCTWWEHAGSITPDQIQDKLTERNLEWHLNHFDDPDPHEGGQVFRLHTPFISTTAGAIERDSRRPRNWRKPSFLTALQFATRNYTTSGFVFYGYVYTLGRKSIPLVPFAEEVRELHIYTDYLKYHPEGEVVAKIWIPAVNLQRYEKYDPASALEALRNGQKPDPVDTVWNAAYAAPEQYANVRGMID